MVEVLGCLLLYPRDIVYFAIVPALVCCQHDRVNTAKDGVNQVDLDLSLLGHLLLSGLGWQVTQSLISLFPHKIGM